MDETDLALLLLLIRDSRAPYSALAKHLKMSVPSVHKRITLLARFGPPIEGVPEGLVSRVKLKMVPTSGPRPRRKG